MRLIRLTTTDSQAIFNASFSDDILFKKDSSIALQNVSIEAQASTITLNGQNNSITYQNSAKGNLQVNLNAGTYDDSNIDTLLTDVEDKLNGNTGFTTGEANFRELGMEWKSEKNSDNKVSIGYKIGTYITNLMANTWSYDAGKVQYVTTSNGIWSKLAGLAESADPTSYMFFKNFIARGCGFTRGKIYTLENTAGGSYNETGMCVGLTRRDLVDFDPDNFTMADIAYGIACRITGGGVRQYRIIVDGVQTASAEPVTYAPNSNDNDVMELMIVGNKVKFFIYHNSGGGLPVEIHEEDYTAGQKLYPVNVFFGTQADARLRIPTLTESPYVANPTPPITEAVEVGATPVPIPRKDKADNFLEFQSTDLANFLGYQNARQPQNGFYNVKEQTYIADEKFSGAVKADAFLVESLTLPLDSYDSFVNQRKNILAVIPESDATGAVIYEPSTPFFIDVKNENDLILRNLRFRIVKNDYTPFNLRGLATLTLLIT